VIWTRVGIAVGVIVAAGTLAKLVDSRMAHRQLDPAAETRYKVLRRSVFTAIVFVGVFSALLVIPQVRAIAGGVLASSAVLGLILGLASQRTLGNFVAGLLIAFSQPIRLGDEIEVEGVRGEVEEIGLTYTWVRTADNDRLVIPNEKIASDAVRNSTIRSSESRAEVTLHVPADADLERVLAALEENDAEAYVTDIGADATVLVRCWVPHGRSLERAESDLRLASHRRLRELGVIGGDSGKAGD
jgi:small-conductance mechanosensitive channel